MVKDQAIDLQADTSPEVLLSNVGIEKSIQQTQFVLWVGNVPGNATISELEDFFCVLRRKSGGKEPTPESGDVEQNPKVADEGKGMKRSPADVYTGGAAEVEDKTSSDGHGVVSIKLMAKSNCAFVNYATPGHLLRALQHFDDRSLRPIDTHCPNLVCRIRSNGGRDLHSVSEQHRQIDFSKYAREHEEEAIAQHSTGSPVCVPGERSALPLRPLNSREGSKDENPHLGPPTSKELATSRPAAPLPQTEESRLRLSKIDPLSFRHDAFKERFFIMKSFQESEFDRSVAVGTWTTQEHNVTVLNEAFCNSDSVFLIFSANQSGRFFGYARMTGSIRQSLRTVSVNAGTATPLNQNATNLYRRSEEAESVDRPAMSSAVRCDPLCNRLTSLLQETNPDLDPGSGHHAAASKHSQSCPDLVSRKPATEDSALSPKTVSPIHAMPNAPFSTCEGPMHEVLTTPTSKGAIDFGERDVGKGGRDPHNQRHTFETDQTDNDTLSVPGPDSQSSMLDLPSGSEGHKFALAWISTVPVPFGLTRDLRNPWKANLPIKVSRDGTELEPSVGRQLLVKWRKMSSERAPGTNH